MIAPQICRQYNVIEVGAIERIRERFYAISVERRITHPAVAALERGANRP